jgi:hypothetical protein
VISIVPPALRLELAVAMAPPYCQMNNNELIWAALSEIVKKKAFDD